MKCTPSHEWIEIEGDVGIVGITSSAQKELGEIVFIQLPTVGTHVNRGEEVVVIESTKAAADIYSPVSGVVIAVNHSLAESLQVLNKSPEKDGWLYRIHMTAKEELDGLLSQEEYAHLVKSS